MKKCVLSDIEIYINSTGPHCTLHIHDRYFEKYFWKWFKFEFISDPIRTRYIILSTSINMQGGQGRNLVQKSGESIDMKEVQNHGAECRQIKIQECHGWYT
jgi:hypothetical protein